MQDPLNQWTKVEGMTEGEAEGQAARFPSVVKGGLQASEWASWRNGAEGAGDYRRCLSFLPKRPQLLADFVHDRLES